MSDKIDIGINLRIGPSDRFDSLEKNKGDLIILEDTGEMFLQWDELLVISNIGRKTQNGGEIFNNYTNNKANALFSTTFGNDNITGSNAYKIKNIADWSGGKKTIGGYQLVSNQGIEVGMKYVAYFNNNCVVTGTVTQIVDKKTIKVSKIGNYDLCKLNDNEETGEYYDYLVILGHPELGEMKIGNNSFSLGNKNCSYSLNSFSFGTNNNSLGRKSATIGEGLLSIADNQLSIGKFNKGNLNTLFEIGNGTDNNNRINVFEVYNDGHIEILSQGTTDNSIVIKSYVDNNLKPIKDKIVVLNSLNSGTSENSLQQVKSKSGSKAFKVVNAVIWDSDNKIGGYQLESITGIEVGMHYVVCLAEANYVGGKVLEIVNDNTIKVDNLTSLVLNELEDNLENGNIYNYLMIVDHPELGDFEVGFNAVALGDNSTAYALDSIAGGRNTKALGKYGVSLGNQTEAGHAAFSTGTKTKALGFNTFTMGEGTLALGWDSFAGGKDTKSLGKYSFAQNLSTKAIGDNSTTFGNNTEARGEDSFAGGHSTIASAYAQTVFGRFNKINDDALFIIGNGTSDADENRNNAFIIYKDGHAEVDVQGESDKSVVIKESLNTTTTNLINATDLGTIINDTEINLGSVTDITKLSSLVVRDMGILGKHLSGSIHITQEQFGDYINSLKELDICIASSCYNLLNQLKTIEIPLHFALSAKKISGDAEEMITLPVSIQGYISSETNNEYFQKITLYNVPLTEDVDDIEIYFNCVLI